MSCVCFIFVLICRWTSCNVREHHGRQVQYTISWKPYFISLIPIWKILENNSNLFALINQLWVRQLFSKHMTGKRRISKKKEGILRRQYCSCTLQVSFKFILTCHNWKENMIRTNLSKGREKDLYLSSTTYYLCNFGSIISFLWDPLSSA